METTERNWHVEAGGAIHEINSETLNQWIREGRVLPNNRISRGGMRWLEAGKVPQFAGQFAGRANTLPNRGPAGFHPRPGMPDEGYDVPSAMKNAEPSFGLRLAAGSMVALIIAALLAYAWSYHIATPRDFISMMNEPAARELQKKFDQDKQNLEAFRNVKPAVTTAPTPAPRSKLGPAKTGDIASRRASFGNMQVDLDSLPRFDMPPPPSMPAVVVPTVDVDKGIADLTVKFEADKKKIVEDMRTEDSKKRFLPAIVLLFLGLGGMNVVRMKLSSKK
jgi:hypothetical protein